MRYLSWILKLALFLVVLSFAVKNTDSVSVRYFLGAEWQAPLVLVLLLAFFLGAAAGVMTSLVHVFRLRREAVALRRALRQAGQRGPDARGETGS